jgi:UDP-glucose 4-epimerase
LIEHPDGFGEVFNIGGTEEISILNLAERIIAATGSASTIEIVPYDKAFGKDFEDMQRRVPSVEKIQQLVGFDPKTSLDAILSNVVNFMRQRTNSI